MVETLGECWTALDTEMPEPMREYSYLLRRIFYAGGSAALFLLNGDGNRLDKLLAEIEEVRIE